MVSGPFPVSQRKKGECGRPVDEVTMDRYNIYALLTKREVKMAGYWPIFFSRFYGLIRGRGQLTQKLTRPISSHLDRICLGR